MKGGRYWFFVIAVFTFPAIIIALPFVKAAWGFSVWYWNILPY